VQTLHASQPVDLKPAGNTVAITTVADNPFTGGRPVSIRTQASGGMPGVPESMQSRGLQHSFLPGLGQSATKEVGSQREPSTAEVVTGAVSDVATGVTKILTAEEERKRAEAEQAARIAEARAAEARANADVSMARLRSVVDKTSVDIMGMRVNLPLLIGGGALLYFMLRKRKK
jgi:hypothetical protein